MVYKNRDLPSSCFCHSTSILKNAMKFYATFVNCAIFVGYVASSPFVLRQANLAEEGSFIEGDIISIPADEVRNLVRDENELWPNKIFPYEFDDSYDDLGIFILETAISDLASQTCVKFQKRTNETSWVIFENQPEVCASVVGYKELIKGGPIPILLGLPGCQMRGQIQHEILHALGFWHEHTRPDRDDYVNIIWDNIKPGRAQNFEAKSWVETQTFGLPYDLGSVMHYRSKAFSKNGEATMVPIDGDARDMGQRFRVSKLDIAKLNRLYDCSNKYYKGYDLNVDV